MMSMVLLMDLLARAASVLSLALENLERDLMDTDMTTMMDLLARAARGPLIRVAKDLPTATAMTEAPARAAREAMATMEAPARAARDHLARAAREAMATTEAPARAEREAMATMEAPARAAKDRLERVARAHMMDMDMDMMKSMSEGIFEQVQDKNDATASFEVLKLKRPFLGAAELFVRNYMLYSPKCHKVF